MFTSGSIEFLLQAANLTKSKRIRVWVNGDLNCHEFNINPREFRTWNSILLYLTEAIQPNFGAIRKLVSLKTKHEVWGFEAIDSDDRYIAFGGGSQTKIAPQKYKTAKELDLFRQKKTRKIYAGPKAYGEKSFIYEMNKKKLTVIYITLNGVNQQTPQKVVFNKYDINNWQLIINYITKIMSIPEGVGEICTIYGVAIKNASEFQSGYLYVVVPNNIQFIYIDYMRLFELNDVIKGKRYLKDLTKFSPNVVNVFVSKLADVD